MSLPAPPTIYGVLSRRPGCGFRSLLVVFQQAPTKTILLPKPMPRCRILVVLANLNPFVPHQDPVLPGGSVLRVKNCFVEEGMYFGGQRLQTEIASARPSLQGIFEGESSLHPIDADRSRIDATSWPSATRSIPHHQRHSMAI